MANAFFWNRLNRQNTMRICFNSQVATIQSTCIACNALTYAQTCQTCTGQIVQVRFNSQIPNVPSLQCTGQSILEI
ncbi:unnamed protein product [Oppiella nova]|uniref:Uncharacterized protein n=1 Tax=Oppiella nova TaxID=334625 RepID=A0A7R9LPE8_9ACAR|nr:unnamed protein product [Oppiella nova]CAG2165672.1 unnamed protein product [Oppiella nova]